MWRLRSAPASSRTARCMCRRRQGRWPVRCPNWNGRKPSTMPARCFAPQNSSRRDGCDPRPRSPASEPPGDEERSMRLLMIDNYDSFTYIIVQYLGELGADVEVFRNDANTLEGVAAPAPPPPRVSPRPPPP